MRDKLIAALIRTAQGLVDVARELSEPDAADGVAGRLGVDPPADLGVGRVGVRNEVDGLVPLGVDRDDRHGVLHEILRDGAGRALDLPAEGVALGAGFERVEQVHDDAGLALPLPKASGADVRAAQEATGDVLLHPTGKPLGVHGDCPAGCGELPDAAADVHPGGADGSEVGEGTKDTGTAAATHDAIIADLAARRGRVEARRWVLVDADYSGEMQRGGVLVETCWLPPEAGRLLGPEFTRGGDGRWRAVIPTKDYCGLSLGRVLQRVALAMAQNRDEGR